MKTQGCTIGVEPAGLLLGHLLRAQDSNEVVSFSLVTVTGPVGEPDAASGYSFQMK